MGIRKWMARLTTKTVLMSLALFIGLLLVSIWWLGPAPPRKIILATGPTEGTYATLGKEYQQQLKAIGLEVELVHTNGSVDNLKKLLDGRVDVAFVQGGAHREQSIPIEPLCALAAVGREPLFVFSRKDLSLAKLSDCLGMKVCVGAPSSGTAALARLILKEHGITQENTDLIGASLLESVQRLKKGTADIAFFVLAPGNPLVEELMRSNCTLLTFQRRAAYAHHFPYLTQVTLPEGALDLKSNYPRQDEALLAPTTQIVSRKDLHPQVVERVLGAARNVHAQSGFLQPEMQFPSEEGMDLRLHPAARRYMTRGEPWLSQILPYWMRRHFYKVQILLLPLLTLLIPYLRIVPWLYRLRIHRLMKAHYKALRELEERLEQTEAASDLRDGLRSLENLRTEMEAISRKVPGHYQQEVYHWRLHIIMVRNEVLARLRAVAEGKPSNAALLTERSIHMPGLVLDQSS